MCCLRAVKFFCNFCRLSEKKLNKLTISLVGLAYVGYAPRPPEVYHYDLAEG